MPCAARLFYRLVERAVDLRAANLAGDIEAAHIAAKGTLRVQPARRDGGNPLEDIVFSDGDFSEQIVRHGAVQVRRKRGTRLPHGNGT
jgi:hypothetical protein